MYLQKEGVTDFIWISQGMTPEDVMQLTPKFWKYHLDLIHPVTASTFVLATIQYNLAAGTIGAYATGRPDLQELMDQIMKFDVS
jgi:acyl-CoA oxidase